MPASSTMPYSTGGIPSGHLSFDETNNSMYQNSHMNTRLILKEKLKNKLQMEKDEHHRKFAENCAYDLLDKISIQNDPTIIKKV